MNGPRRRRAEYLLAAHACATGRRETTSCCSPTANDLNPKMIVRWKAFLRRRTKAGPGVRRPGTPRGLPDGGVRREGPGHRCRAKLVGCNPLVPARSHAPPESM